MSLTTAQATRSLLTDSDRAALAAIFADRAHFDEPLSAHTSWKIGGPADALVLAHREEELAALMRWCFKRRMPWMAIGGGSNMLVGDGGLRGVGDSPRRRIRGDCGRHRRTTRSSSKREPRPDMAAVTAKAATAGAAGVGSLSGIPGTIGGSLCMNAGTDREIGDFVRDVWVHSPAKPAAHPVTLRTSTGIRRSLATRSFRA